MRPVYPWCAVVGQDAVKRALLLCAIDPALGGVLIRGPRGVAKSTLARALGELVPGRFVELPLGASEERVAGTLDLDAALQGGRVTFKPGLLADAHEGVLYVDEVNLLADPLVDLLLDAAASGHHQVERDGVSHEHPARFVLVGTMNPEEGELRPQLLDRFGLCAAAEPELAPAERAEILALRLAFDADPDAFRAERAAEQQALRERCRRARERLPDVALAPEVLARVSERCHAEGVEGVRADLAMLRAARALAAWHARTEIEEADLDAVAELALAHRRPPEPGGGPRPPAPRAARGGPASSSGGRSGPGPEPSAQARSGERGARPPLPVAALPCAPLPGWIARAPRRPAPGRGPVDWFRTLCARRPRRRADLRFRRRRPRPQPLIVAVDGSASMLRGGALAAAKGLAQSLASAAERQRRPLALIAFHGEGAASPLAGRAALAALGAGGGTPLRAALARALELAAAGRGAARLVLLTDGRTREDVRDLGAALRARRVASVVIDCERAPVSLGRCAALARALGARLHRPAPPHRRGGPP